MGNDEASFGGSIASLARQLLQDEFTRQAMKSIAPQALMPEAAWQCQ
jgi:hypothetical protein